MKHSGHDGLTRRGFLGSATALGVAAALPREGNGQQRQQPGRLVVDGLDASVAVDGFLEIIRSGGAHCVHRTLFEAETFRALHAFVDERPGVVVATTVREIRQAHRDGKISFVLGAQAAGGMFSNRLDASMNDGSLGSLNLLGPALQSYKDLGLRTQGLCYNTYNVFGSGCLDHTVPLTRAGRRLVEEIHARGILLDIGGHTGERTSFDAIDASAGVTIVCTHSNFAALNPNMRCISDRLAEAIASTGGVIGLTAISDFLMRSPEAARRDGPVSPLATLDVLLDHFDHGKRLVGVDHIALGPDFVWGQGGAPVDPEHALTFPPHSLSAGPVRTVEGFEDISRLPNLVDGLRGRGWTEEELDKVLGENWLRVYEEVWGA